MARENARLPSTHHALGSSVKHIQRVHVGLNLLVEDIEVGVIATLPIPARSTLHVSGVAVVAFTAQRLALDDVLTGLNVVVAMQQRHPVDLSPATQPDGTDSITLANKQIATAMEKGSNRFEWMHKRVDGSEFPAEVLLNALQLEGRNVLQAVVRDITERKQTEQQLKDRSVALEAANEALKVSNQALEDQALELEAQKVEAQAIAEQFEAANKILEQ